MKTPVLGGQYIAESPNAGYNRAVNLYLEMVKEGGKEPGFLTRCPGLTKKATIGTGANRGFIVVDDYAYVAVGLELYQVDSSYSETKLGDITGTGPVSMSSNGIQIFVACNPNGFIYNTATDEFKQITDPDFPGAVTVDYLDGYFIFNEPNSQKLWVTSLLDGTAIDPLEFASAEGNPDNLVAVHTSHRECWAFGTDSVEVYFNSGALDFPLTRIAGAFIETGCLAPHSIAMLDNSLFWLGSDKRGVGIIYRAEGYAGRRVSDHSIETLIQGFDTISDAEAYSYQQSGHSFYVLTFPTEDRTFVFDVATQMWHERASFDNGLFKQHVSRSQMVFNGKVHVGDRNNGNIYTFDLDVYADNGEIQKWLRTWRAIPTGHNSMNKTIHHQLQLDCEAGVGLNAGQGLDSQVMLRWSDDGGHTWSNVHIRSLGRLGKRLHRVMWRRLGSSRDRVYELSGTDPNSITIMGAELKISATSG